MSVKVLYSIVLLYFDLFVLFTIQYTWLTRFIFTPSHTHVFSSLSSTHTHVGMKGQTLSINDFLRVPTPGSTHTEANLYTHLHTCIFEGVKRNYSDLLILIYGCLCLSKLVACFVSYFSG